MSTDVAAHIPGDLRDRLTGWRPVRCGAWRWLLRPDVWPELASHSALDLDHADEDEDVQIVKQGTHRTIRKLAVSPGGYYLKQFHQPDWGTALRHWFRGGQARWEWSRFRAATRCGIPTPDVVAIGRCAGWAGETGLITRGVPGVVPLDQWIAARSANLPFPERRQLTDRLAAMVAGMHCCGAAHRDLHAGNVLVQDQPDGPAVWLVDLSPLRIRSHPVHRDEAGQNLGRLRHSLLRYLTSSDQAAFFRAWWRLVDAGERQPSASRKALLRTLARRCDSVARSCWEQMDRKWTRGNRKIIILDQDGVQVRGIASLGRDSLLALSRDPEKTLQVSAFHAAEQVGQLAGQPVIVVSRQTAAVPRGTGACWARHAWDIGHALQRRLIAAPAPMCLRLCQTPSGVQELLVFPQEQGWQRLSEMLGNMSSARSDDLARRVIDLLRRLQSLEFTHRGLSLGSFEARQTGNRWQLRFACLESIDRASPSAESASASLLVPLIHEAQTTMHPARTVWLRWWKYYLGAGRKAAWKPGWRKLTATLTSFETRRAA